MKANEIQEKFISSINRNDFEEYRKYLHLGAMVNEPDNQNCMITPLLLAIDNNCNSIVKDLLENGANANLPQSNGTTPLMMAAQRDNLENVKLLIQYGAEINAVNEDDMQGALVIAENWDVIRFLVQSGADLEIRDDWGQTPLAIAARIGDEKKAEILLELGANPFAKDNDGQIPLEIAKKHKNKYVIELLKMQN